MPNHFDETIRLARLIGLDYQYDDKKRIVKRFAHAWVPWRPFEYESHRLTVEHWVVNHPAWAASFPLRRAHETPAEYCERYCQAALAAFGQEEKDKLHCAAMAQALDKQDPDSRGPAIVTHGSITTGFSFRGPFATVTDAAEWLAGQAVFAGSVVLPTPVDESPALTPAESEVALAELTFRLGEAETSCRLKEETIVRDIRVMASDRQRFEEELKTLRDRVARRDGYLAFVGWSAKGVSEAQEKMAEQAKLIEQLKAELADAAITNDQLVAERDRLQRVAGMPSAEVAALKVERDQLAEDRALDRDQLACQANVIEQLRADLAEKQALFDVQWTRTQEAESLWRAAHPGKENVLPDLGTLIGWLVRSQHLLDRITDGARWCGRVADGVGVNVYLWNLPYCNGRHGTTLLEAAEAGLSEEVSND